MIMKCQPFPGTAAASESQTITEFRMRGNTVIENMDFLDACGFAGTQNRGNIMRVLDIFKDNGQVKLPFT